MREEVTMKLREHRDLIVYTSLAFMWGVTVGLAASLIQSEPTEKVFTAKVVKINDRLALDGAEQTIVPLQWVKLVEGDTHCVRINYDADGFVSRVDVSNP